MLGLLAFVSVFMLGYKGGDRVWRLLVRHARQSENDSGGRPLA